MHWFMGTVENAVQETIKHGSTMLVFISNSEPASTSLLKALEASPITNLSENRSKLIAVRLEENTTAATQFAAICREASDAKVLLEKLKAAIPNYADEKDNNASSTASSSRNQHGASSSHTAAAAAVSAAEPDNASTPAASPTAADLPLEAKIARARELVKQKQQQREREQEQAELNKQREQRESAKLMQDSQRQRQDDEMKKLAEQRRREKLDDIQHRQKILRGIEADRNEKKAAMENNNKDDKKIAESSSAAKSNIPAAQPRPLYEPPSHSRILFRLPDSTTITQQFDPSSKMLAVSKFVAEQVQTTEFTMLTPMPLRHLDGEDMQERTLRELDLYPTATIIVKVPTQADLLPAIHGSGFSHLSPWAFAQSIFYMILRLIAAVFDFFAGMFYREHWFAHRTQHFDGTQPELVDGELMRPDVTRDERRPAQEATREDIDEQLRQRRLRTDKNAKKDSSGTKSSNIMRMSDINQPTTRRGRRQNPLDSISSDDDSDDEATYNGNSTQQL